MPRRHKIHNTGGIITSHHCNSCDAIISGSTRSADKRFSLHLKVKHNIKVNLNSKATKKNKEICCNPKMNMFKESDYMTTKICQRDIITRVFIPPIADIINIYWTPEIEKQQHKKKETLRSIKIINGGVQYIMDMDDNILNLHWNIRPSQIEANTQRYWYRCVNAMPRRSKDSIWDDLEEYSKSVNNI